MLLLIFRKMLNNKWMVACLLVGSILAAAMLSSIPLYTKGVLQRMLTRDLENSQKTSGYFPGHYHIKTDFNYYMDPSNVMNKFKLYKEMDEIFKGFYGGIGLPAVSNTNEIGLGFELEPQDDESIKNSRKKFAQLKALSGFNDHIKIINGRSFSSKSEDGIYEAVISEQTMKDLDLVVDRVYTLKDVINESHISVRVKVVGVYTLKELDDPFWFQNSVVFSNGFIMDYNLMKEKILESASPFIVISNWYYALDYHKITLENMKSILSAYNEQRLWFSDRGGITALKMSCIPILEQYYEREKLLKTTLWILQVPIIIMLAFYIFMVSQLIIDYEKNEIAVMKSRGASGRQIFLSYLMESSILGGVTLIGGPPLGMLMCSIMGASNGFLEFVQRTALRISLNWSVYIYALLAIALFIITMLIPAVKASKSTIVQYKQSKARTGKKAAWHKYFLDLIMLAIAGYGYYRYSIQKSALALTGVKGTELAIDPLLFLTSTLFILGTGLFFIRLFPYIIHLIFWIGRKVWSPSLYASFIHVGRSAGQEQFLMLFLIFTLSIGIFSSNSARTINRSMEDRVSYQTGADMVIRAHWEIDQTAALGSEMPEDPIRALLQGSSVHYIEPYFPVYNRLSGVETATKVFRKDDINAYMPTAKGKQTTVGRVNLMGILPNEFGKAAWFRNELLPYHINQYLNLMTRDKTALLLSRTFQTKYDLKEGDPVSISWASQGYLSGVVYAFIDYWPAYNPNSRKGEDSKQVQDFIVANLSYIHEEMALEPYFTYTDTSQNGSS